MLRSRLYLFFWVALLLSGCSFYNKTAYIDDEGRLPESFFNDLHRSKTSQSWVLSQLGDPESVQQGPDSKQIFNYRLSRTDHKHADFLVVMRIDGKHSEVEYLHILFEKQLLRKHWRDDYSQAQTSRYFGNSQALVSTAELHQAYIQATPQTDASVILPAEGAAKAVDSENGPQSSQAATQAQTEDEEKSLLQYFKVWPWSTDSEIE